MERLAVGEQNLKRAWESSQRSTVEDWFEWMRHFSVELLKQSPSPALRATAPLAQVRCTPTSFSHSVQAQRFLEQRAVMFDWWRHLIRMYCESKI